MSTQEASLKEESDQNIVKNLESFVGLKNAKIVQKCLTYQFSCNDSFWDRMEELGGKYLAFSCKIIESLGSKRSRPFSTFRRKVLKLSQKQRNSR